MIMVSVRVCVCVYVVCVCVLGFVCAVCNVYVHRLCVICVCI